MNNQPKFSEVLRAAAKGCLPFSQQNNQQFSGSNAYASTPPMNSADYEASQRMASVFNAMAAVYEKYEQSLEAA